MADIVVRVPFQSYLDDSFRSSTDVAELTCREAYGEPYLVINAHTSSDSIGISMRDLRRALRALDDGDAES